jgi:nicotinamidase/pyrazinamidase
MAKNTTGVIVVDVQADFTELAEGTLAVRGTDQAFIDKVQTDTEMLKHAGLPVFATQDWHPPEHISFFTNHEGKKALDVISIRGKHQVLWPPHCVQGRGGAQLLVDDMLFDSIIRKGTEIDFDSYSGFQDDGGHETPLHDILQQRGVTRLVIYGIATDYCIKATVLDALERGYQVIVIKTLIRGVAPDTSREALREMEQKGVTVLEEVDLREIQSNPLPENR